MADASFSDLVVVGSSAGGLEALSRLVSTLPEDFSAPVVIAQHLDPDRASHLEQILSRRSTLPVRTVAEHERLKAGVVYVVPSNRHVHVTAHEMNLTQDSHKRPMPSVDLLFSSAAESFGERLIAVLLSGTGSDGAEGARIARSAGGVVLIQDPETAEFRGMPGSLTPSTADVVADLGRLGHILGELVSNEKAPETKQQKDERRAVELLLGRLSERYGIDFRSYKRPTIMRRLKRRMVATGSESIEEYAGYLEEHPGEYRNLINTLLMKATEFFPELFDYLREEILPTLIDEARERGRQLGTCPSGCAPEEEAHSLTILVSEVLGGDAALFNVRVIDTDANDGAVDFARRGIYPPSALSELSGEQIDGYFIEENEQHQVNKPVHSLIVFGEHDRSLSRERQARQELAGILESISDAFFAVDGEWRFAYINQRAEQFWSSSREELLGKNIWEEFPQLRGSGQYHALHRAMVERLTTDFEVVSPVTGAWIAGRVYPSANGLSVYFQDVTERKKAEEEREQLLSREWTARAQAEERRRISRELHDRVAHTIALVHQSLELHEALKVSDPERAAAKMELARKTVKGALESTRNLSMELRCPEVRRGLEAALADLMCDMVPPDVRSRLLVRGDETPLSTETRNQLFLILREAVRNAVSHAEAGRIAVELEVSSHRVVGRVEDDGRGFAVEATRRTGHNGLTSMEERTALLGGTLSVSSTPGEGTSIELIVPLGEA